MRFRGAKMRSGNRCGQRLPDRASKPALFSDRRVQIEQHLLIRRDEPGVQVLLQPLVRRMPVRTIGQPLHQPAPGRADVLNALAARHRVQAAAEFQDGHFLGRRHLVNRFFSAVVRVQTDRGHTVVDAGPYRWMRHPAYAGGVIANLAVPLMLGSAWALIPGALTAALTVLRTALEDRTLRAELPGYADYAGRTRWRLCPGVW